MFKLNILLLLSFFCVVFSAQSQQNFTLQGTITTAETGEPLPGVNLIFTDLQKGLVTDINGHYEIKLPRGTHRLEVRYLGFETRTESINLSEDTALNLSLRESSEALDEVIVRKNIEELNIRKPQMSVSSLNAETIKEIPAILGEADVIKSLLLLPGVTSGGEGSSGFNVRGGAADQNLILLDDAQIFNSSHLFGFFSVFNPDAIQSLDLYKGGIPSRYGGRVSSVLAIDQKEGDYKDFKVNGGLGIVSSRLLVEGPIVEDKVSFLVGGRTSYAHLFLPLFDNDNSAYFYDVNTKLSYAIDQKNKLHFTGYFGRDVFNINDSFKNSYGNDVANLEWRHLFTDNLYTDLSLIYTKYSFDLDLDFAGFKYDSGIENYNFKYDFNQYINEDFQLDYGVNLVHYAFNPGDIKPNSADSGIVAEQLPKKYANEFSLYAEAEHALTQNLNLRYGFRLSHFIRLGENDLSTYANDLPLLYNPELDIYTPADPTGTISPDKNTAVRTFTNFEPRLSLAYSLSDDMSIKASYNRMAQYIHLISNTNSPTPLDVYTPSGTYIEPQLLDQYAVGYNMSTKNGAYSFQTEAFYKDVQNRLDYRNGAQLIATSTVEREILAGKARAYGLELLLKKNEGAFTGWLAYTLSRSEQRTPGRTPQETGINNGNWYPTAYDKTHDLSLYANYKYSPKWNFNANLVYQTGRPTNYPISQSVFQGLTVANYGPRNGQRLPAYHRLDVSATLTPEANKDRDLQLQWIFSIYNLYNRKNAASINFERNDDTGMNEAVQISIFGIIPSVTLNFKF